MNTKSKDEYSQYTHFYKKNQGWKNHFAVKIYLFDGKKSFFGGLKKFIWGKIQFVSIKNSWPGIFFIIINFILQFLGQV